MDRDEEEGLRAFALNVGVAASDRPEWVMRDRASRVSVAAIESAWREEERLGFRVRLSDGAALLLYYVPELEIWSGVEFATRVDPRAVKPRAMPAQRDAEGESTAR